MLKLLCLFSALILNLFCASAQLQFINDLDIPQTTDEARETVYGPVFVKGKAYCILPGYGIMRMDANTFTPILTGRHVFELTATADRLFFGTIDYPSKFASIDPEGRAGDFMFYKIKDKYVLTTPNIYKGMNRGYTTATSMDKKLMAINTVDGSLLYTYLINGTQNFVACWGNTLTETTADTLLKVLPHKPPIVAQNYVLLLSAFKDQATDKTWRNCFTLNYKSNKYLDAFDKQKIFFKDMPHITLTGFYFQTDSNVYVTGNNSSKNNNLEFYKLRDFKFDVIRPKGVPDSMNTAPGYLHHNTFYLAHSGVIGSLSEADFVYREVARTQLPYFERLTKNSKLLFKNNFVYARYGQTLVRINLNSGEVKTLTENAVAAAQTLQLKENPIYGYATDKYFFWVEQKKNYQEIHRHNPIANTTNVLQFPKQENQAIFPYIHGEGNKLLIIAQEKTKGKGPNTEYKAYVFTDD